MKELALAGAALVGTQGAAQTIPKTAPENLAPAPIKAPLPTPTPVPAASNSPIPVSEQPLVIVPIEASSAPQGPPRARPAPLEASVVETKRREREPLPAPSVASTPSPVAPAVAPVLETTPTPKLAPTPTAEPSQSPAPAIAPTPQPEIGEGLPGWLLPAGLGGVAALIAGFLAWRRRRGGTAAGEDEVREIAPPESAPVAEPPARPAVVPKTPTAVDAPQFLERPAPSERAWVDLALPEVRRAGINLVTATADIALVVRNEGNAPARAIRVAIRLTSAQQGQDAALAALFAQPIDRPAVPPFDLAPGEERAVRGIATLTREEIVVLEAAGRPMFVPVVALNVLYDAGGGSPGQTTAAFAIGVERAEGGKLGPLWLDEPARMHDAIGIRAHGTTLKR